jgi:branched-subunit amino acid transport protein
MYRYGHAQAKLVRMHGMFRLIHYVPVAIFLAIIASLYLLKHGLLSLLLAFCITSAIFAIIYFLYKTKDIKVSLRYFFHLAVVVVWWNAGFLAGLITLK